MAPQKINVLKQWIQDFVGNNHDRPMVKNAVVQKKVLPKLCILVGGPGIGKSTMVRVIAKEMNMSIIEWNDTCGDYGGEGVRVVGSCSKHGLTTSNSNSSSSSNNGEKSSMDLFEEFLHSVALPYKSVLEERETLDKNKKMKKKKNEGTIQPSSLFGSIVLLDELPNLYGSQHAILPVLQQRFRLIMRQYIEKTWTPTILVLSNVTEGRYKPEDLETYLDPELLYSPLVFTLQVNPVTKAKMKSCLKDILKKEGISSVFYSDSWLEELHLKCGGDLRHAITSAQFQLGVLEGKNGMRNAKGWICSKMGGVVSVREGVGDNSKDVKLSTFHALGKLLYAKRVKKEYKGGGDGHSGEFDEQRPPLEFDPERVLEDGDIGIAGALSFIQHHAPDFFTHVEELSCAFDLLSDGTFLVDGWHEKSNHSTHTTGTGNNRFPLDYAVSLCSRAVAHANRHPAPYKFRQLCAPTMYQAFRKRRENRDKYDQFCKRVSFRDYYLTLDINTRSSEYFATDYLPFMKRIVPDIVTTISGDFYTTESQNFFDDMGMHTHTHMEREEHNRAIIEFEQQRAILEMDDIVDSSEEEGFDDEESIVHHDENCCHVPIPTTATNHKILPKNQNEVIIID